MQKPIGPAVAGAGALGAAGAEAALAAADGRGSPPDAVGAPVAGGPIGPAGAVDERPI